MTSEHFDERHIEALKMEEKKAFEDYAHALARVFVRTFRGKKGERSMSEDDIFSYLADAGNAAIRKVYDDYGNSFGYLKMLPTLYYDDSDAAVFQKGLEGFSGCICRS
ncbi:MAG: hypothetical protein Q7S89_02105 [bacterium]|nr:hypothetical protein [bacterium]